MMKLYSSQEPLSSERDHMSLRVWLKKDGDVEVARLMNTGVLANLKINDHHTTGKKYIKLRTNFTDPTVEVPQIPQEIVERVTFKGTVFLLGEYHKSSGSTHRLPLGSFHSADMATYMLILANNAGQYPNEIPGRTWWCEVSVTGPSITTVQEMLYRLISPLQPSQYDIKTVLITSDEEREYHQKHGAGCFKKILGFPC